ncbi:MAG: translation initiation factor IF-6 [Candidatus Thermoplasmatota archaeon]
MRKIAEVLDVEVIESAIAGSSLLGALCVLTSYGCVVTDFATNEEIKNLSKKINIARVPDKLSAVGNNILANDRGAIVHPQFGKKAIKVIEDVLGVEAVKGTIAGLKTVGSAGVATNRGLLCHPKITEEEKKFLENVLKVDVTTGTANYGVPFVGACVIANTKGAMAGMKTTGIELGRISSGLRLD